MVLLACGTGSLAARDSVVAASAMPAFPGGELYLWSAHGPGVSADSMLAALRGAGVEISETWVPGESQCMRMFDPPQVLVRVTSGGDRCAALEFARDGVLDPCYVTWRHLPGP
jgi:hypothetical protein